MKPTTPFPPGARVRVDGKYAARVRQAWPEGSTSYLFAHYTVDFERGDRNVAVSMGRVSA